MVTTTRKENEMTKAQTLPMDTHCAQCGRPIATCTVGGLHGMLRERAAKAWVEMRAAGKVK